MDIELAKCECCGLKEDCTQAYISEVKEKFDGKWLCGLCSEAVRDEIIRGNNTSRHMMFVGIEDAVKAHMSFCRKYKSNNPATRVADGMRQMLRRRCAVKVGGVAGCVWGLRGVVLWCGFGGVGTVSLVARLDGCPG
nr:uncharacterized protein LOC109163807 [Ipomoea batatas]